MKSPRIIVIAQARMGSSRLPGKVLKTAGGVALIEHLAQRVLKARLPSELWIATTQQSSDDPLAHFPFPSGVQVFRGDEHDVLKRYYETALQARAEIVVRVTGDCPLLDPTELDRVIQLYLTALNTEHPYDYVTNQAGEIRRIPRGLDVEVMSFKALEKAYLEAHEAGHREHVTPYLYQTDFFHTCINHPEHFDLGHLRLTVDTPADLHLVQHLFEHLGHQTHPLEIAEYLDAHPDIYRINAQIKQRTLLSEEENRHHAVRKRWLVGRADRSFDTGSGHVARLSALLTAWVHLGGKALLIGGGLDEGWQARLKEMGIESSVLHGKNTNEWNTSFEHTLSQLSQSHPAFTTKSNDLHWMCFDGYHFLPKDLELGRQAWGSDQSRLLLIDDHAQQEESWYQSVDGVINQNLAFDLDAYPPSVQSYCKVGSNYALLRPEFWTLPSPASSKPPSNCMLLITFGSSDPQKASVPLLQHLHILMKTHPHLNLEIKVLIGPAFDPDEVKKLESFSSVDSRIHLLQNQTDIASLFVGIDLAITAGGTTTWELLRCNVWPLVLRIADNQDVVMEGLKKEQIGGDLGVFRSGDSFDWNACTDLIKKWIESFSEQKSLRNPSSLVDGRGVWRVIDFMCGL